ncbi:hypothetical protein BAE44_0023113 [Dichanthelium oligosanthes]|uniref:KIB1-4 beta-propeller domain-containing protein n=1 Tax=Dichanthelium oligosanthes TaxID=888268 RepID=A0A1E5USR3_9POAL|nr:hypothetical protein BAE44_0023113 [Dichanthelium oligosanthes]
MAVEYTASAPAWSDILPEILGRIAACCPKPADRASFRAVCSSWHAAARHHCPRTPLLPWAVLPDGSFLTPSDSAHDLPSAVVFPDASFLTLSDGGCDLPSAILLGGEFVKPARGPRHLTLPENTTCVGSTGGWLALCRRESSFLLHNTFSDTTVPLPDVDAVGAKAPPRLFDALKVLMRSTAEDVIAVLTRSRSYPFVLSLPQLLV